MAANMAQMGQNGQSLMMPRQLQPVVYQALLSTTQPNGWQVSLTIQDRLSKTMNLITNCILAAQNQEWTPAVRWGIDVERKAYLTLPNRQSYEQHIALQVNELAKKRQANAPELQNQLASDAVRQSQLQAQQQQQQQMLMNHMAKGMSQPMQQGLQHLQHQMQPSPMPQQAQQTMDMGLANNAMLQNRLNQQQQFALSQQQQPRAPNSVPADMSQLSAMERRGIQELAMRYYNAVPEQQKQQHRADLLTKMNPQVLADMQNTGRDPLIWLYQQKAFANMQRQAQERVLQQRNQGMPPNMDSTQAQAMLLQHQQQQQARQMNQGMMNLGQQPGVGDNPVFNSIRNDQKAAMLAQQNGQVVVPASSGPNRNPTPQSMAGLGLQNMPNTPQGSGPQARPQMTPQQQQQLQHHQQMAQQVRMQQNAGRPMQQLRGLQGPGTTSQSPGMSTLTAPMQQAPVPMGGLNGVPMNNQPLGDPRFNVANRQFAQANILNHPMVKSMLQSLTPEHRQSVSNMPIEKIKELVTKWSEQQRNAINSGNPEVKVAQMGAMNGMNGQVSATAMNRISYGLGNVPQPQQPGNPNMLGAARNITEARFNNALNTPGAQNIMDSMDIPQGVLGHLSQMALNIPPDAKKWAQLKSWMSQLPNALNPQLRSQLQAYQLQQFKQLLEQKNRANGNLQTGAPMQPGSQTLAGPGPQLPPGGMGIPGGVPVPPQVRHVTAADVENYRKTHPAAANLPNEMVSNMLAKLKVDAWTKKYYESQGINPPVVPTPKPQQQQPGMIGQPAVSQPAAPGGPAMANTAHGGPQKQSAVPGPDATANKNARPAQQPARPVQNKPSPPAAQKGLKRPNPDEMNDGANQVKGGPQPAPPRPAQVEQRNIPQATPEQLARMTPEQRARYEQLTRGRQQQPPAGQPGQQQQINSNNEIMQRLKALGADEQKTHGQELMPDIPMTPEEKAETTSKIQEAVRYMSKMGRGLSRWYGITRDDHRARLFFKIRMRLVRQFVDGDKMLTLKDTFSIRPAELDTARAMMESMAKDLAAHFDIPKKQEAAAAAAAAAQAAGLQQQQQQQAAARAPPTQLSAANLEKQTQALNKAQHQKPAGKNGATVPAAPTTSQPPAAPFGAQQSPTGQPTYLNAPSLTQDNLQLPTVRKKQKTGPHQQQTSSPSIPATGASPQLKPPSPEARRQPLETKAPKFVCHEADCDMHTIGFATEEARKAHHYEEHVKPQEDPVRFAQENLAVMLGLDMQGNPLNPVKNMNGSQSTAPSMRASLSRQGQTPMSKPDLTSTPMSRDASMKRQSSTSGIKMIESMSTPGKLGSIKTEGTPKLGDVKSVGGHEHEMSAQPMEDPWANSTIDPQSLFASFAPLEPTATGLFADLSAYRAETPNDTPESSKDSGASEPNSDISDAAHIDIDLNWHNLDADLLMDMNNINMETIDYNMDMDMMGGDEGQLPTWDETEFNKQFRLDPSLFSMDTLS